MPNFAGYFPLTSGEDTQVEAGSGGLAGVLIGNESGLTVVVKMGAQYSRSLYPGMVDYFAIPKGFNGNIVLSASTQLTNVSSWPGSFAQVDLVGLNEVITGTYPMQLSRNTNVGNAIDTNVTGSTLVNTGNPAGTSNIIEIANKTSSGNVTTLDNNGNLVNGNAAYPGTISFDNSKITSDGAGTLTTEALDVIGASSLDNGAITTSGAGTLTVGQSAKVQADLYLGNASSAYVPIMYIDGSNVVNIKSEGNGTKIQFVDGGGNVIASLIDSNTLDSGVDFTNSSLSVGKIYLQNNSIKGVNSGHFSASGTINHGLNGTPANVLLCPSLSGSTWTFSAYSFTSTQFSATINSANNTDFFAYR